MSEIHLRQLEPKDIPGMLEWMHDPEVNRWFRFDPEKMTAEKAERFIAGSFTETDRHYAVADKADNYLGTISLEEIDKENGHALYAIGLRTGAQGRGVGLEATRELLRVFTAI